MWDLIVSVPDHCLSFYFSKDKSTKVHKNWVTVFKLPFEGQMG